MTTIHFYGTSEFAVPSLEALARDKRFQIAAVITQPDRPVGRHAEMHQTPIKVAALKLGLPVLQIEDMKSDEAYTMLTQSPAGLAVVASYGQIIPQRVLDLYPSGAINVHGSILPAYRGASPIAASIANGDDQTGVTIMLMDAKMDHGPTLSIKAIPIDSKDTTTTLTSKLAEIGAELLMETLPGYLEGTVKAVEQDHDQASFVKLLKREDGKLDAATMTAIQMERLVRAYEPWPNTYIEKDGKRIKILKAHIGNPTEGLPTITGTDGQILVLDRLQLEGKPPMDGAVFLRGYRNW